MGDDTPSGRSGEDRLYGDVNETNRNFTGGDDRLFSGTDVMHGDGGDDLLVGGFHSSTGNLTGGSDTQYGGAGADTLYGDVQTGSTVMAAMMRLAAGTGPIRSTVVWARATLDGQSGADVFVFVDGFGTDQVTDWNGVVDVLGVSSLGAVNSFADWSANAAVVGADVVLIDGANSTTFAGTALADFTAGDFIF